MDSVVRQQRPEDAAAVRRVITAAFAGGGGAGSGGVSGGHVADLAEALRARTDRQCSLVAVAGDAIVGHTHLSVSWIDAPRRLVEVLTLSPLSVDPASQRQGIGAALVEKALAAAAELGAPIVFLEGDPGYYERLGWRPATQLGFTPPSARIPDAAFQAFPLAGYDPATTSGALVYNDTFWSHDSVGLRGG